MRHLIEHLTFISVTRTKNINSSMLKLWRYTCAFLWNGDSDANEAMRYYYMSICVIVVEEGLGENHTTNQSCFRVRGNANGWKFRVRDNTIN